MRWDWIEAGVAVLAVQMLAACGILLAGRREAALRRWLPYVVSLAVGVLLATGTLHLLPDAVTALGNRPGVWLTLTITMIGLFGFERIFRTVSGVSPEPTAELAEHECKEIHHHSHAHGAARPSTLLLGSLTHSLVDGTSIGAAFAVDARLGWVTALAVGLHEVPHRLGDFALLLHMGLERRRAAWLAIAAGMSSLVGWGIVVAVGAAGMPGEATSRTAWLLPVSAGSFLYISLVDLLPELFEERSPARVVWQVLAITAGAVLAWGLTQLPGA